jgi:hypothetical protein
LRAVTNELEQDSRPSRSRLNDQPLSRGDRLKRIAINIFLVFHILAITCWCIPLEIPGILTARKFVRPYFLWSGLFQSWDMFAPTPKSANTYVEAQIRYKDGTEKVWTLPRMQSLGLTHKFIKERYRKFEDNLVDDANDAILTDVSRHIARSQSTPGNPVKLVVLVYNWSFFAPDANGSFVSQPWEQHVLLGYGVRREDLK